MPLLASVVLVAFGLWLRLGVPETPEFLALEREEKQSRAPLGEVFTGHWRRLLVAGGSRFGPDVMYSLISAFCVSYVTTILGLSRTLATGALAIGAFLNVIFIFVAGTLSDRFGRRAVYGAGVARRGGLAVRCCFRCWIRRSELAIVAAFASGLAVHAFMYGPQGAFIAEQFPARVRYVGASVAYTFAGVFAGGLAPLAFTALYRAYGKPMVVALYTTVALVITAIVLRFARVRRE